MNRFFLVLLLALAALTGRAGDIVTATVVISSTSATNLTGTNAASITIDSDTRIATNSVVTASTQFRASTNEATAAFYLLQHLRAYPFAGVSTFSTNNGVVLVGAEGAALDITITNSWATVAYRTNTVGTGVVYRAPRSIESATTRAIVDDDVITRINSATTNTVNANAAAMANFVDTSEAQTVNGVKVFTDSGNIFSGKYLQLAHSALAVDNGATNFWVDMTDNAYRTITATNDIFFQATTNRAAIRNTIVRIDPNGTNRLLGFNTDWTFLGTAPTNILSTNIGILSLTAFGTSETNIIAAYGVEGGGSGDTDDQTAAEVDFTPSGGLAATDVQAALEELDTEKAAQATTITVAGTANEITSSAGAQDLSVNRTWTLSLPSSIDIGGKTSFEIPNAAAPTVDAFGEIAGDNNLWDTGRGAVLHYDGTAVTALIGVLTSDTPANGEVPKWNTGGTITWEADSGAAGGDSISVDGGATTDPNFDDGGDINFAYAAGTITATVNADSVTLTTDTTGSYAAGDAEAGGATKITQANTDATLSNAGEMALNTADEQLAFHSAADGEISGEVAISLIQHKAWSFDPDAVCDGSVDRLFLMTIGDNAPEGIIIDEWKVSFEADPTTEVDLDLKYADAFIGVANPVLIDVLDTTSGVSSEDTDANINSGSAIPNGKVMYLEFGTAYTESNHQVIFEIWYHTEED